MKYRSEKIQKLIEDEVSIGLSADSGLDVDQDALIQNLITPPKSMRFRDRRMGLKRWLWAVWDSSPGDPDGLLVVVSPHHLSWTKSMLFGVATKPNRRVPGAFHGFSGSSFWHAMWTLKSDPDWDRSYYWRQPSDHDRRIRWRQIFD